MIKKKHKKKLIDILHKISVISAFPALVVATAAVLLLPVVVMTFAWDFTHMLAILYIFYGIQVTVINRKEIWAKLKEIGHKIPLIDHMMREKNFRFRVFLYWSTFISFLMLVFYIWAGWAYGSFWFFALAGYNLVVMGIRMIMSRRDFYYRRKGYEGERLYRRQMHTYRWVGVAILFLNIFIGGMGLLMTFENQYFPYHPALIMSIALFAIYRFVTGFINAKKFQGNKNKIFSAAKVLDMIIGIMAMYTLQTTLLSLLPDDHMGRFYANLVVGIIVFLYSLIIGIRMIIRATVELNNMKHIPTASRGETIQRG